ncbi:MAG: DMT family transporter [Megasphaera sp.]|jgi:drug/metabolite transporter (DMT)-like permease|nr:DMT family transporter [Megasphaera sp.]MCI1248377.1 DMT family transporter [Megasphaera sp.]
MEETESKNLRGTYLLLILTTAIWGIQPLCIKWLVTTWSPVTITAMRYIFIGTALILIAMSRGEGCIPRRDCLPGLLVMGITGIGINNVLQFTGLQISTVTNCTLIAAASPAITAFMAAVFIHERMNIVAWAGIVISFIGAIVVVSHGSLDVVLHFDFNRGDIFFFLAQIAWTIYSLAGLRVMRRMSAALVTGWAGLIGAAVTIGYGLVTDEFHAVWLPMPLLASFAYTVIFGGIMAMLFWNIGVKNAGPSVTSIFQNITPVVGMIGGTVLFAEVIGIIELSGALAIFIGVYLTTHCHAVINHKFVMPHIKKLLP